MAEANREDGHPGGLRACPYQTVAVNDPELIDAVGIDHRSLEGDRIRQAIAERFGDPGIAPDRQQRLRQTPRGRAEMNVAGQNDVRGA